MVDLQHHADIVDVGLTSLGFQVQNMYSWNKAGSPDRPWHIGPHRASLPKPENDIRSKYFHSFSALFLTHLQKNSNLNHIVLRGLALPGNGAVAHRGSERG